MLRNEMKYVDNWYDHFSLKSRLPPPVMLGFGLDLELDLHLKANILDLDLSLLLCGFVNITDAHTIDGKYDITLVSRTCRSRADADQ